tara:strand:+ start:1085 stop:1930 length:846 start_codon:yes stop_codon:yes gene_type:complete
MSHYGFDVSQSFNDINEGVLSRNRMIRAENRRRLQEHQNDITDSEKAVSNLNTRGQEEETLGEALAGQIASKGKDIQAVGKAGKFAVTRAGDIGNAIINSTEDALYNFSDNLDRAPMSYFRLSSNNVGGDAYKGAVDFLEDAASKGKTIAERGKSLGKLGGLATGLTIGSGVLDAVDDIETGKIVGNNTAEKVGNVAGIVSGGLETIGTALDLTGVGAPVGVALNLLGGLTSLVGAGADIVGEEEEKTSAEQKVKQVVSQQPQLEKQQAIQVGGETGAEVK